MEINNQKKIKRKSEIRSINDVELFKTIQQSFGSFIETVLFKKETLFLSYFTKHLGHLHFFFLKI